MHEDSNLLDDTHIRNNFSIPIGHSEGVDIPMLAVAAGARVIETFYN